MKKLVILFVVLTVFVAVAILLFNRPENTPKAASVLPDSTILFVDLPDFQSSRTKFPTTPLYQLWQEKSVQAFLEKPLAAMRSANTTGSKNTEWMGMVQKELPALIQGECFLAVTHLDFDGMSTKAVMVAGADLKTRKHDVQTALESYTKEFVKDNPGTKAETKTWLGTKYTTWTVSPAMQVHHAFVGSLLILSENEDALRDVISRAAGQAAQDTVSLAASPRYQEVLREFPGGHDVHVFLNIEQLVNDHGMWLVAASQASPTLGGIPDMRAWATSISFNEAGVTDVGVLTYVRNHKSAPSVSRRTLSAAPADSAFYSVGSTDLAAGYISLMNMLASVPNPQAKQVGSQVDKFLAEAGVRLADDFLAHLGPEVAYVGNWRPGAPYPDVAIVVEVKDKAVTEKFDKIVAALKQAMPSSEDIPYSGETLHVISSGSSTILPTYVLTDKFLIIALNDAYAKEIVVQTKNTKSSLLTAEGYSQSIHRLPTVGSSIMYCDLQKVIGGVYGLAKASATNADVNSSYSLDKLPPTDIVTRYLGAFISTTVESEKASVTTSHSSVGKPVSGLIGIVGGLVLAQPWLSQLSFDSIPGLSTTFSGTDAPRPPAGNQKATSQTP